MKRVVSNEELKEKLGEAINLLCDTVKVTLGPRCSNVIIDHSTFSPFITNDGVTIASNIESDDPVINTILELAKEASIKTNENVGDGTTTTLVLLQSIFNNGLTFIKNGINPIVLKKELDTSLDKIINIIKEKEYRLDNKNIRNLVSVSANDKEIGKIISDAYFMIGNKEGIKVYEGNEFETKVNYLKGYTFDTNIASPYFFLNNKEIILNDARLLLIEDDINNIELLADVINHVIEENQNLIVIAKDYSDKLINDIIALNMELDKKIYLLKSIEYGNREKEFYDDLKDITGSKILKNDNIIGLSDLGKIKNITINKEYTKIEFITNKKIKSKVEELEKNINEDYEYYSKRINMLKKGIVNILVGAPTVTERREKKMRFDDALCALGTIDDGILPGGGLVLLEISDILDNSSIGTKILKEALKIPFETIIYNAGINKEEIYNRIKDSNYKLIYNIVKNEYEDIYNTEVIDSKKVIINTLTNAVSISGMLLTTSSLIINEYQNNLNKENGFGEI